MKEHYNKNFPPKTSEDYYVECAIDDVHMFLRNGMKPRTWTGYLKLLDNRLNYFLGQVDDCF